MRASASPASADGSVCVAVGSVNITPMSEREQYGELADELEGQADGLAEQNERLGEHIADVRHDWDGKRADAGVPGVTPDWDDPDEAEEEEEEEEEDDDEDEHRDRDRDENDEHDEA